MRNVKKLVMVLVLMMVGFGAFAVPSLALFEVDGEMKTVVYLDKKDSFRISNLTFINKSNHRVMIYDLETAIRGNFYLCNVEDNGCYSPNTTTTYDWNKMEAIIK